MIKYNSNERDVLYPRNSRYRQKKRQIYCIIQQREKFVVEIINKMLHYRKEKNLGRCRVMTKLLKSTSFWFNSVVLLLLIVFFSKVCPVIPFNGDDWFFTGTMRLPIPIWNAFNPVKVLPEVLEPLGGLCAAYIIYPITHDYVASIAGVQAVIISLFITLLFYSFYKFVRIRLKKDERHALIWEFLFVLSFFFVFKKLDGLSYYGFWAPDLNCYFNYIIPGIVNACIVLYMARYENFAEEFGKWSYLKKGFYIVIAYFSIFSSIQLSIILSVYCSYQLLMMLAKAIKNRDTLNIKSFFSESKLYILELICWSVSLIFELNGFRAEAIGNDNWLTASNIKSVAKNFISLYRQTNKLLIAICTLCVFIVLIKTFIHLLKKDEYGKKLIGLISASVYIVGVTFAYLFFVYLKAGAGYASVPNATWALLCYILIFANIYIISACDLMPKIQIFVPITIAMIFLLTFSLNFRFRQSVFDYDTAKEIDETIINQIVKADREGKNYVEVQVPYYEDFESNWPQPDNMAIWLQNGLYAHNIVKTRMKIVFVRNKELYNRFYSKDYDKNEKFYDFETGSYLPKEK